MAALQTQCGRQFFRIADESCTVAVILHQGNRRSGATLPESYAGRRSRRCKCFINSKFPSVLRTPFKYRRRMEQSDIGSPMQYGLKPSLALIIGASCGPNRPSISRRPAVLCVIDAADRILCVPVDKTPARLRRRRPSAECGRFWTAFSGFTKQLMNCWPVAWSRGLQSGEL